MRAPADLPRRRRSARVRIVLIVAAALLVLLAFSLRGIAGFYTDYLWFDEIGITSVWKQTLGAKSVLGFVFTFIFFIVMWANLAIADLLAPKFRPMGPEEEMVERYHQAIGSKAGMVRVVIAAVFALIAGPGAAGQWNSWILFRNHVAFSAKDAQFGRDIGFYVFDLPFLTYVVDWLFATFVIVLIVTAVAHYLNGGIRFQTPLQKVSPQVKAHLSVLMAVLALLKAVSYYLDRFELVYSSRGVVQGANYTDVKAELPALNLLFWIMLFACGLFLVNILRRGWILPMISIGLWALVSVVVGAAIPTFVQQFRVQPQESTREAPYIDRNIKATRTAYNLRDVVVKNFEANDQVSAVDLTKDQATVQNMRLWDPAIITRTYKRLQQIRNFYQFNDVDVDRYPDASGANYQILLSARELRTDGIPSPSWVKEHLVYTHGYAAVMSTANGVESDGNPVFLVKDLPPVGKPQLTQPAIYFGQGIGGYAIVRTAQPEVDYIKENGTEKTSFYEGTGGVQMNSWLRRAALAARFWDYNALISSYVSNASRAVYIRNIDERVRKAAPFLRFDSDPYPVIYQGGIHWVYDGYTTTSRYPYAQRADTSRLPARSDLNANFNYARNSVKVVIDAYNGSMRFYVTDTSDPIIQAYRKAFPALFTDQNQMDDELRRHLRYPEDLFRVQSNMYGRYHITDPGAFYNNSDAWDIAQEPGSVSTTGGTPLATNLQGPIVGPAREGRMDPYYLLMRLPEADQPDFLMLQPFVPFSKDDSVKDLSAFMIAKSDPGSYGQMEAYVMPRDRRIDGPALVNSKINQDTVISSQITLLNTSGSKVVLGNLLLIPVQQSLLWVRPLYTEAEGATPLPQLKKVIVVFGDKVVMENSLREALGKVFGEAPPTLERQGGATAPPAPTGNATPPTTAPPPGGQTLAQLLAAADSHFENAQNALRAGDLATYQREVNAARDAVNRAAQSQSGTTSTTRVGT